MIDFPSNPTPNVTTVTQGRKTWLCVGLDSAGRGIWDLTSTPDQAAADAEAAADAAEAALVAAQAAQAAAEAAAALAQGSSTYGTLAEALAAGIPTGKRFFIRQGAAYAGLYEHEKTATGSKFIAVLLTGSKGAIVNNYRALRNTLAPNVAGLLVDLWGSDGIEWDGRVIPNRITLTLPTLNWNLDPFNPLDEVGTTPTREPNTTAILDNLTPQGNRAEKITATAQGQFLTTYRSTYGIAAAVDLRVRVEHQQLSGGNQWRLGLASTGTGTLMSSTVGVWTVTETTLAAFAGTTDLGFGSNTANVDGQIAIQNYCVYDPLAGETSTLPTAAQELAAQTAGHMKRCMSGPGAFSLLPAGYSIQFTGYSSTVTLDPAGLPMPGGFTFGGWFNTTQQPAGTTGVMMMGFDAAAGISPAAVGTTHGQIGVYGDSSNAYRIGRIFLNPTVSALAGSPASMHYFPNQGNIFFAMSVKPNGDGATATQTYFINGIPWVNTTGMAWDMANVPKTARLLLGAWNNTVERRKTSNVWVGDMNGVFFTNRPLSNAEIIQRQRYMIDNLMLDGGTVGLRKAYFIFEGDSLTAFSPSWAWSLSGCTAITPRIQAGNVARGGTDIGAGRGDARKLPMLDKIKAALAAQYERVVIVMRWGTNEVVGLDPWSWINNGRSHVIWRDQYYLPLCNEYKAAGAEVWHVTMPPRLGLGATHSEEVLNDLMIQTANDDFRDHWKEYGFGNLIDLGLGTERLIAENTIVAETRPGGNRMMNWRTANGSRTGGTNGAIPHAVSGNLTLSALTGAAVTATAAPGTFVWHDVGRKITALGSPGYGRITAVTADGSQATIDTTDVIPTPWPGEPALVSAAHKLTRGGGFAALNHAEGAWSVVACQEEWQTDGIHQNNYGGRIECDKAFPIIQAFHDTLGGYVHRSTE